MFEAVNLQRARGALSTPRRAATSSFQSELEVIWVDHGLPCEYLRYIALASDSTRRPRPVQSQVCLSTCGTPHDGSASQLSTASPSVRAGYLAKRGSGDGTGGEAAAGPRRYHVSVSIRKEHGVISAVAVVLAEQPYVTVRIRIETRAISTQALLPGNA